MAGNLNKLFGTSNQVQKPGTGLKAGQVGEPNFLAYGHEGIRGALLRAGRPSGPPQRISAGIIGRARKGQL